MKVIQYMLLLVLLFVAFLQPLHAQTARQYEVHGRVLDLQQQPISMASVRLLDANKQLLTGSVTQINGAFALKVTTALKEVWLEIRFVGYQSLERKLTLREPSVKLGNITLKEDEQSLRELTVVGKATEVAVKGDTIEYNASSYTLPEGEALEALLKKLPGAEVNESGEIMINGKSISKIMVDGKRFFESDPKVALKNLPADLVDKVQVLDRATDNARMTGFADGEEETIINLTVKKSKKQGIFGTAYAGYGTDKRYEANAAVNQFTNGNQWTVMAGANNTNNAGFSDIASDISQSELLSQMSGSRRRGGSPSASMGDGVLSSKLIGGNLVHTFSQLGELSSGAFWGQTDKERVGKSHVINLLSTGNTVEQTETTELNRKNTTGANLRFEWKPTQQTEVIVTPQINYGLHSGSYTANTDTEQELTALLINSNQQEQTTEGRTLRSEVRADASHRFASGRTLALSANWDYGFDDSQGTYRSALKSLRGNSSVDQRLDGEQNNWGLRSRLSYVEPLGKGYALQLLYQLRLEQTNSHRDAYELDALTQKYSIYNSQYSNRFESDFVSHRAGLALKKGGKAYDVTAGFNLDPTYLQSHSVSGGQQAYIVQRTLNYSPTLRIKYKPSKAFDLGVDYRGRSFQPSTHQLSPVQDVTNQLVIYQGNPNLRPGYRHNLFGRLSVFNAPKQSSLMLFAHLQYIQNDIVARSTYDGASGVRHIGYTNVDGNGMIGFGGFYSTPIFNKLLSLRISTQNSLLRQIGFIQGERNTSHTLRLRESVALALRRGIIDTSLKGSWGLYTSSHSLGSVEGQTTHDYRVEWDSQLRLGGLTLESSTNYRTSSGYVAGFDREQWLINLGISYSFLQGKAATLRFKVYDLLAQQQNVYRSISALSVATHESNILGRYAMLHFIYKFSKFGGNTTKSDRPTMPSASSYHRGRPMM